MTANLVDPWEFAARAFEPPPEIDVFKALEYVPTPKQQAFHDAMEFDVLFGGSAGGGKVRPSSWRASERLPATPVFASGRSVAPTAN